LALSDGGPDFAGAASFAPWAFWSPAGGRLARALVWTPIAVLDPSAVPADARASEAIVVLATTATATGADVALFAGAELSLV
jgi:hypothetical protein